MIKEKSVIKYCKDFAKIENYDKAIADNSKWHIHHRLETHKYKDRKRIEWIERDEVVPSKILKQLGLYYDRPAEELIFLTEHDHMSIHGTNVSDERREASGKYWKGKKRGPMSEETKKKLSEIHKGRTPWIKGKHHTEETKRKLSEAQKGVKRGPLSEDQKRKQSEAMKGHTVSEETRQKIRESLKGHTAWNKGKIGVSDETRKKMSESAKRRCQRNN